jgi:hypothetical protein
MQRQPRRVVASPEFAISSPGFEEPDDYTDHTRGIFNRLKLDLVRQIGGLPKVIVVVIAILGIVVVVHARAAVVVVVVVLAIVIVIVFACHCRCRFSKSADIRCSSDTPGDSSGSSRSG